MIGNKIILSSPFGQPKEGTVSGTPKPGTVGQIKSSGTVLGKRPTYEVYSPVSLTPSIGGDGAPGPLFIFTEDTLQGFSYSTAYVDGKRCFLWAPNVGDEVNVRRADVAGTSSAREVVTVGEKFLVVQGTGLISSVAVGVVASPVSYPFQALEAIDAQPAEMLIACMVIRNG